MMKGYYIVNSELQNCFVKHTPLVLYPFGLDDPEVARLIAEGFLYTHGMVVFDIGWNQPQAGNQSIHYLAGKITREENKARNACWRIGKAVIYALEPDDKINGEYMFLTGVDNRRYAEKYRRDKYKSRNRAEELANQFAADCKAAE